jgi:hypothetical protein
MSPSDLPTTLQNAKTAGLPWSEVAMAVRAVVETSGEKPTMRSPTLGRLATWTQYSAAILRRQLAVLSFAEQCAAELRLAPREIFDVGFTALELTANVYRQDSRKGLAALEAVLAGETNVEKLRAEVTMRARDRRSAGATGRDVVTLDRHERRSEVEQALQRGGFPDLQRRRPDWKKADPARNAMHGPVCRFDWWRRPADHRGIEGFALLHLPLGTPAREADDRIARAIVASSYFVRFWIVLTENGPWENRVVEALNWADPRLGLLVVSPDLIHLPVDIRRPAVTADPDANTGLLARALDA